MLDALVVVVVDVTGNNRQTEYLQRSDEIGTTLRTVNQIGLMFRWLVDDVNQQALNVQQACNEIEQGNSYLHGQTEQLAVNVAQTSVSMEQITARVTKRWAAKTCAQT